MRAEEDERRARMDRDRARLIREIQVRSSGGGCIRQLSVPAVAMENAHTHTHTYLHTLITHTHTHAEPKIGRA